MKFSNNMFRCCSLLTKQEFDLLNSLIDRCTDQEKVALSSLLGSVSKLPLPDSDVVLLDFDGTLSEFSDTFPDLGKIRNKEQVVDLVESLHAIKYRVGVYTSRPVDQHAKILDHLQNNGISVDFINIDPMSPWKTTKPLSRLYIDDLAFFIPDDPGGSSILISRLIETLGE